MPETEAIRILVVEDDPDVRRILSLQLRARGFAVESTPDGAAGYAALQKQMPDCVILDLMMPVMDGFELLKRIRSVQRTADLPIVILTASEDDRHRLRSQQYCADAFVSKPYDLDAVVATVTRLARPRATT